MQIPNVSWPIVGKVLLWLLPAVFLAGGAWFLWLKEYATFPTVWAQEAAQMEAAQDEHEEEAGEHFEELGAYMKIQAQNSRDLLRSQMLGVCFQMGNTPDTCRRQGDSLSNAWRVQDSLLMLAE